MTTTRRVIPDLAEGEALKLLVEVRRAIASEVKSADGPDAVRAALARFFDHFKIEGDQIRAVIREDAIEYVEDAQDGPDGLRRARPRVRREALRQAENNQRQESPSR